MQAIEDISNVMEVLTQHDKLNIRVMSDGKGYIPEDIMKRIRMPHRKLHYFFAFVKSGSFTHRVDLQDVTVTANQLLFILPHQIHQLPGRHNDLKYYKLCFDNTCLSLLPRSFSFLVNPYNKQRIDFDASSSVRVCAVFDALTSLLQTRTASTAIITAHLNSLLTEFDHAYFLNTPSAGDVKNGLSVFIAFKQYIEDNLTEHHAVEHIAAHLAVSESTLYTTLKKYAGRSPKEYILRRLVLEAQRRLYYSETTVKNLAYDLGFTDPDYFSRLFKKTTGSTITQYLSSIQEL